MLRGLALRIAVWTALAAAGPALSEEGAAPADYGSDDNALVCAAMDKDLRETARSANDRTRNFALFDAAKKGCVRLAVMLLDAGASVAARDRFANTALIHAAANGHDGIVRLLLDRGSDINHRNLNGSTALMRAVDGNERRTAALLLERGAESSLVGRSGVPPLAAAAFNGNRRIVDLLLHYHADPAQIDGTGKAPIVYGAAKGFSGVVERLLDAGVDVNAAYGHDLTALMWAAGHASDAPEADGLKTVELLLARGAHLDAVDDRGRTALMIAAERGHSHIAARLLAAGADASARDKQGKTARDLAANDAVRQTLK